MVKLITQNVKLCIETEGYFMYNGKHGGKLHLPEQDITTSRIIMKKTIIYVMIVIIALTIAIPTIRHVNYTAKINEAKSIVDEIANTWHEIESLNRIEKLTLTERLQIDVKCRVLLGDFRELSNMYSDVSDDVEINWYITLRLPKDILYVIREYNDKLDYPYNLNQELIQIINSK